MSNVQFRFIVAVVGCFLLYFMSAQIYKAFSRLLLKVSKKVGTFSAGKEIALQRYVFINRHSLISRVYSWLNRQISASGLKRYGVTPFGYFLFWAVVSAMMSLGLIYLFNLNYVGMLWQTPILLVVILVFARVRLSDRMEKRELDIMDAVDLLIPDIESGVRNAIQRYSDNFNVSIRHEFKEFLVNTSSRGYSFELAMYILTDSLGDVFREFALRAIYYEVSGDPDAVDMSDLVEVNRLRRKIRYDNGLVFRELRFSFLVSTVLSVLYAIFTITTDPFSRNFFLNTVGGNILLLVMGLVVFGVLSYLTFLKSKYI